MAPISLEDEVAFAATKTNMAVGPDGKKSDPKVLYLNCLLWLMDVTLKLGTIPGR